MRMLCLKFIIAHVIYIFGRSLILNIQLSRGYLEQQFNSHNII